ncbi:MAG: hypothetical protein JWN44_4070 [Myxococcales bacterium]|nr:hypothetical protein [Myxococcales bacterium]
MDAGNRRIRVQTSTRAIVDDQPRDVTVVGLSARTALLVSPTELAASGKTMSLLLPTVNGAEIDLMVGVDSVEKVAEGWVVAVTFMVIEQQVRTALNDLMALLLAGTGGGNRKHPRIIYDVTVRHGPALALFGKLEEISVGGLSVRVPERLAPGAMMRVSVPDYSSQAPLVFDGTVVQQRLSKEGGYHTGIAFGELDGELRARLARLLADLLCR